MASTALFDLSGQVAFVTGGASGLGLAMAEIVAEHGARVTIADVDAANVQRVAAELRRRGLAVDPLVLDVADAEELRAAIGTTATNHGRLDIVFANAGISAGPGFQSEEGKIDAVALGRWQQVLAVNLTGTFVTMQAAAAQMKPRRAGRIIVTASIGGLKAEKLVGYAYAATKAAVINLVRQAALELAAYNILVNAIAPGPFFTNIGGGRLSDARVAAAFVDSVPLGRIAQVDEIKGLALLLASPASSYITGAVIPVDGGATAA